MVITRAQARLQNQNVPEIPLNFHLPERQPRQPRQQRQPRQPRPPPQPIPPPIPPPIPNRNAPVFQFSALNVLHAHPVYIPPAPPQPQPQPRPRPQPRPQGRRGRPRRVPEHEAEENLFFFPDNQPVLDQPILHPPPTEEELMIEPMRLVTEARENVRQNQTEIRHKETYKRNYPMVIFHEYADNLNHLMNRMGLISAGAQVLYAFATRNLVYNGRQYFAGLYNWDNRNIMLDNLGNYRVAILGTRENTQLSNANRAELKVFNHYLAVFRWKDPEQDNRISLLFYDPEPSIVQQSIIT